MKFSDVIGQEQAKAFLRRMADSGRISHAQMLSGKTGYGTLALALAYAQYINCTGRSGGDSCGVCPSCVKAEKLEHPDIHYVFPVNKSRHAESKGNADVKKPLCDNLLKTWKALVREKSPNACFTEQQWYDAIEMEANVQGSISRAEADEIIRKMNFKAFESEYKIVILWLPERMHITAANALLKIFEEPFEKTLFLFVTENEEEIIQTIRSRVQTILIPPIDTGELAGALMRNRRIDPEKAAKIARLSLGNHIEAERLLAMEENRDEYFELFVKAMQLSYKNDYLELIDWADTVSGIGREAQKNFIENALRLLRENYVISIGIPEVSYLYGKELDFAKKFAPFVHHKNIEVLIGEFEKALLHISQNGSARIVFTHLALSLSKVIAAP